MRKLISFLFIVVVLFSSFSVTAADKFGIGIVIGDPTGFSFKYGLKTKNSIDAALAWSTNYSFHLQSTYLWNLGKAFEIENQDFDWYTGVGLRLRDRDKDNPRDDDDDETEFGPRAPVGVRWLAPKIPLEAFVEASIAMNIIPNTDVDFDAGIGARWWF